MEDLKVERECRIRQKVSLIFNKRRENFEDLREWNDYLEGVEDVIHSLMTETNVQETQRKLEEYREKNLELINQNKRKEEEDLLLVGGRVEKERKLHSSYESKLYAEWDQAEIEHRISEKHLIDSLSAGSAGSFSSKSTHRKASCPNSPFLTDPLWGQRAQAAEREWKSLKTTMQSFINPLESKKGERQQSPDLLDFDMIHQQMILSLN